MPDHDTAKVDVFAASPGARRKGGTWQALPENFDGIRGLQLAAWVVVVWKGSAAVVVGGVLVRFLGKGPRLHGCSLRWFRKSPCARASEQRPTKQPHVQRRAFGDGAAPSTPPVLRETDVPKHFLPTFDRISLRARGRYARPRLLSAVHAVGRGVEAHNARALGHCTECIESDSMYWRHLRRSGVQSPPREGEEHRVRALLRFLGEGSLCILDIGTTQYFDWHRRNWSFNLSVSHGVSNIGSRSVCFVHSTSCQKGKPSAEQHLSVVINVVILFVKLN